MESQPFAEHLVAHDLVDQRQAEKVMFAASHGDLTFGLLNDKSKVAPDSGVSSQNLFE